MAAWMLSAAQRRIGGALNVAGPPGHTTVGQLLATALQVTGSDAELIWAPAYVLERQAFLLDVEFGLHDRHDPHPTGFHDVDVSAALVAGLTIRPLRGTLADTWAWLERDGAPRATPPRLPSGSTRSKSNTSWNRPGSRTVTRRPP